MSRSILKSYVLKIKNCNSRIDLRDLLKEVRTKITNNRSFAFFLIKNIDVSDKIKSIYFYNSIKESAYRLMNDIDIEVICECGEKCKFLDNNRGYQKFCGNRKCEYMNEKRKTTMSNTFNLKYGCHPMRLKETKEKLNNSLIDKYGFDNFTKYRVSKGEYKSPFSDKLTIDKIKQTFLQKYGGHPMQNEESFSKNLKSRVKFKEYKLPSGKTIKIQGYENFALDYLLSIYDEDDIIYNVKDINKTIGIIYYFDNGIKRRYYPDFYVKSCQKIYEVKSTWTLKCKLDKNIKKKERCESLGINFEFLIYENGNITNQSN